MLSSLWEILSSRFATIAPVGGCETIIGNIGKQQYEQASFRSGCVELETSVRSIGEQAFHQASFDSITIPHTVRSIGKQAFKQINDEDDNSPATFYWMCDPMTGKWPILEGRVSTGEQYLEDTTAVNEYLCALPPPPLPPPLPPSPPSSPPPPAHPPSPPSPPASPPSLPSPPGLPREGCVVKTLLSVDLGVRDAAQSCGPNNTIVDANALVLYLECVVVESESACLVLSEAERVANGVASCLVAASDDTDSDTFDAVATVAVNALQAFAARMGAAEESQECADFSVEERIGGLVDTINSTISAVVSALSQPIGANGELVDRINSTISTIQDVIQENSIALVDRINSTISTVQDVIQEVLSSGRYTGDFDLSEVPRWVPLSMAWVIQRALRGFYNPSDDRRPSSRLFSMFRRSPPPPPPPPPRCRFFCISIEFG
jgi:hypothetical protein